MQLSPHDLRSLPLQAALVEGAGEVVLHTPEWDGPGTACIGYPVRRKRLLVATRPADPVAATLTSELIAVLEPEPAAADAETATGRRMLAASLRLLTGADPGGDGAAADALHMARVASASRVAVRVSIGACASAIVRAPAVVALALVQLIVNAARHGGAEHVTLTFERDTFRVTWTPPADVSAPHVRTARRHADRERWGLGFARIAADSLGASVYPPLAEDGAVHAAMEVGIGRLALPLAVARHGAIVRATRAWDEETGVLPGSSIASSERCAALVRAAQLHPQSIVRCEGWAARSGNGVTHIAIPPDDAPERLQDVLDGIVHERALLAGLDVATAARVTALALVIGVCLGRTVPRVPAGAWLRRMRVLAGVLPLRSEIPALEVIGATDPDLCAVLAARTGGTFVCDDDALWLLVPPRGRDDPMVRCLAGGEDGRVRLA